MGVLWTFLLSSILPPLSPSLWETARYRLKYCLKGPLNPKEPTNVFVVLSSHVFSSALVLRLFHQGKRLHTKPSLTQRMFGNYWAFAVFRGPDLIANLSDGPKIIDHGFITCDKLANCFLSYFGNIWSSFLATLTRCLFCSSVNRCGSHLAEMSLTFKCFFKIR